MVLMMMFSLPTGLASFLVHLEIGVKFAVLCRHSPENNFCFLFLFLFIHYYPTVHMH